MLRPPPPFAIANSTRRVRRRRGPASPAVRFCFWVLVILPFGVWMVFTVTLSREVLRLGTTSSETLDPPFPRHLRLERQQPHTTGGLLARQKQKKKTTTHRWNANRSSYALQNKQQQRNPTFHLPERPRVGSFLPPELVATYRARNQTVPQWITTPNATFASTPYLPLDRPAFGSIPKGGGVPLPGPGVRAAVDRISAALTRANRTALARMFRQCFPNTLETTVQLLQADDDKGSPARAFLITGDIDLMWLRDSAAQVHQYLQVPALRRDATVQAVVEGVIQQQVWFVRYDPYGSSFRLDFRPKPPSDDCFCPQHVQKARNAHVAMHNFELDSLCYPLWLSHEWWRTTGRTAIFTREWVEAAWLILDVFRREQRHFLAQDRNASHNDCRDDITSCYRYLELRGSEHQGHPVGYTGMIWSGFRPSDDQQSYGYLIPSNAFAVVVLHQLAEMADQVLDLPDMAAEARDLAAQVLTGIEHYGIVNQTDGTRLLAYEVDGLGGSVLLDDANVPSLLSLPYLGFDDLVQQHGSSDVVDWPAVLQATQDFVWSDRNPYFSSGTFAQGIGSIHTGGRPNVWHMSIVMKGLSMFKKKKNGGGPMDEEDAATVTRLFASLENTHAGTYFMHESFNVNNPSRYTRKWFAWSNSLFSELVIAYLDWLTTTGGGAAAAATA